MAKVIFTELGLLPTGIHDCTMSEISEAFGRFQRSDNRLKLLDRLEIFVEAVWKVDDRIGILVDGSFIMAAVDEPGDVDIALILPSDWNFAAALPPFKYNILSKRMVRRIHGFDMLVGVSGEASEADAIEFFSRVNTKWLAPLGIPAGTRKGLVRIIK